MFLGTQERTCVTGLARQPWMDLQPWYQKHIRLLSYILCSSVLEYWNQTLTFVDDIEREHIYTRPLKNAYWETTIVFMGLHLTWDVQNKGGAVVSNLIGSCADILSKITPGYTGDGQLTLIRVIVVTWLIRGGRAEGEINKQSTYF